MARNSKKTPDRFADHYAGFSFAFAAVPLFTEGKIVEGIVVGLIVLTLTHLTFGLLGRLFPEKDEEEGR